MGPATGHALGPAIGLAAFPALGTGAVVLVTVPARLEDARRAVAAEVDAIDRACSRFRPDSELEGVNGAGGRAVAVGGVLLDALEAALRAARLTDGDVDPTVGHALRVLGYDRDFAAVPPTGRPLVRAAAVPGWRLVRLERGRGPDRGRGLVRVPAGVRLDLTPPAEAPRARPSACAAAGWPRRARPCAAGRAAASSSTTSSTPPPAGPRRWCGAP